MRITPILAGAAASLLVNTVRGAQEAQVMSLSADSPVVPGPSDYDPAKLDQDRFASGSELDTPQLTYFPAPASAKPVGAIIICPGGGYARERLDKEGYHPALWLNSLGISAFVLRYRLPHGEGGKGLTPPPLEDVQRAVVLVRSNAAKWNLDPKKIGVMGWSAGGHLAGMSGTFFHDREGGDRPDFLVLLYPVITMREAAHKGSRDNLLGADPGETALKRYSVDEQVTPRTPPTFIAVARDDAIVPVVNSTLFAHALRASGVSCDLVLFEHGGHGFCMGVPGTDSMNWTKAFGDWAGQLGLTPVVER